jgi:hypothetical protein
VPACQCAGFRLATIDDTDEAAGSVIPERMAPPASAGRLHAAKALVLVCPLADSYQGEEPVPYKTG